MTTTLFLTLIVLILFIANIIYEVAILRRNRQRCKKIEADSIERMNQVIKEMKLSSETFQREMAAIKIPQGPFHDPIDSPKIFTLDQIIDTLQRKPNWNRDEIIDELKRL